MNLARGDGILLIALLLAPLLVAACASDLASGTPHGRPAGGAAAARPVATDTDRKVVRVTHPKPAALDDAYPANLYVERDVKIAARTSGVIEAILVDRGERVRAGQALARLETDLVTREVEMAAQELRLARAEYDRLARLNDERIISPQEFQRAEIARDLAESKAALARARLDRATIRAPFDGVVVERWAVPGQRVQEDDNTALFRVVAHDPLRVRVDLPEERIAGIAAGAAAWVELPGSPTPYPARVVFVSPASDAASGTIPVILEARPPRGPLRPGASVRVHFGATVERKAGPVRIPREALSRELAADAKQVNLLVVADDGTLENRRVEVIDARGADVIVRGPIAPRDRVVLGPIPGLEKGEAVLAREETP